MSHLPDSRPAVSPLLTAALLLAARRHLSHLRLPHPTARQILDATGATHTRAYDLKNALLDLLPTLERPAGRPRAELPPQEETTSVTDQVLSFVMQHPGSVYQHAQRNRYSDGFRCFILELCELHRQVSLEAFARAVKVPLGTLKDWLRGGRKDTDAPGARATAAKTDPVTTGEVQTVIEQWRRWEGDFSTFCKHVRFNLRIDYGRTLITSILEQHGERTSDRRPGCSPDEKALRKAFETFFPGAQWVGDGTPVDVQIGGQRYGFNLELMVDAHSAANVGISTRDEEDSAAVVEAFDDGVQTTGASPLCTLLDNRPSNHTANVDEGLGASIRMYATKGRAQNKGHVEGAFGLFFQVVPLLAITATTPKEMARQILQLIVQTWARTLNHRPRTNRNGLSRVEIYTTETPTSEQIEQARAALEARLRQQEKARETLRARQDPFVRDILDGAFARLALVDPEGNIRAAIARYPLDAVVNGIAIFEGRHQAGTLPDGVNGRYLLGIVKNISRQDEGLQITEALLRNRLDAQDRLLTPLRRTLDTLLQLGTDPIETLKSLVDLALEADRQIDRIFWLAAIADHIRHQPGSRHAAQLRFVSQRIYASFAVHYRDRQVAVRFICTRVIHLG
jgi:hypothetical protein